MATCQHPKLMHLFWLYILGIHFCNGLHASSEVYRCTCLCSGPDVSCLFLILDTYHNQVIFMGLYYKNKAYDSVGVR
jgi:hypothetical protein